jgi:hypothetical protein
MRLPATMDEYRDLVEQALIEVEDLRYSVEFDEGDELAGVQPFLGDLEGALRALRQSMLDGSYAFGDSDLPYMRMIVDVDPRILPFKSLLERINRTHRTGLAEADE